MEGERAKENPRLILLFSGKRKSGKDFVTDLLQVKYDIRKVCLEVFLFSGTSGVRVCHPEVIRSSEGVLRQGAWAGL